jgi:hypothetical protein
LGGSSLLEDADSVAGAWRVSEGIFPCKCFERRLRDRLIVELMDVLRNVLQAIFDGKVPGLKSMHFCFRQGHTLENSDAISIKDLAKDRFLLYARENAPELSDAILSLCKRARFSPDTVSWNKPSKCGDRRDVTC